ncbi:MAG: hypothetical protein K2H46_06225 [Muribaculaceae bacterium]|nr:hypothetical protein [Muribaculaceae bacterium]
MKGFANPIGSVAQGFEIADLHQIQSLLTTYSFTGIYHSIGKTIYFFFKHH